MIHQFMTNVVGDIFISLISHQLMIYDIHNINLFIYIFNLYIVYMNNNLLLIEYFTLGISIYLYMYIMYIHRYIYMHIY